jgi:hypothetical protein
MIDEGERSAAAKGLKPMIKVVEAKDSEVNNGMRMWVPVCNLVFCLNFTSIFNMSNSTIRNLISLNLLTFGIPVMVMIWHEVTRLVLVKRLV